MLRRLRGERWGEEEPGLTEASEGTERGRGETAHKPRSKTWGDARARRRLPVYLSGENPRLPRKLSLPLRDWSQGAFFSPVSGVFPPGEQRPSSCSGPLGSSDAPRDRMNAAVSGDHPGPRAGSLSGLGGTQPHIQPASAGPLFRRHFVSR